MQSLESHLYAVRYACAVHPAGHINGVSPNVILRLACTNDPRYHRPDVQTLREEKHTAPT